MNKVFLGAFAALSAVACASVSDKTTLQGTFADAVFPLEVHVTVPDLLDTVVTLQSPEFKLEVPVCKLDLSVVEIGDEKAGFISDGTVLNITRGEGAYEVESASPKISIQSAYNHFSKLSSDMVQAYRSEMRAIADSSSLSDAQKDSLQEEAVNSFYDGYIDLNKQTIAANTDNILSLAALRNIYYELSDGALDTLLNTLAPEVAEDKFVAKLRAGVEARKATAEGGMFKDFTVTQPDGKDVSLSDYVGKGKYVLVDFWASWCGPCKREIPNIKAVYDKYHGSQFDVLSVAVWDEPQASVDTAKAYGVNWNEIVNAQSVPTELYGIQGIPHIILFGPDGTIIKRDLRGEAIEEEVLKYVK